MEPIIALSSSPIKSAIHIIRSTGTSVLQIVSKFFSEDLTKDKGRNVHVGYIKNKDKIIDQVVLLTFIHPNSYTGEDVVEILCHGNPLIDKEIIDLLIANGMRMATNGEFTQRAYINKKMDLIRAEAVNDLINATTIESKQMIMHSLTGEVSNKLLPIKNKLLNILANLEVNIDYSEYKDIEVVSREEIAKTLKICQKNIKEFIKEGEKGLIIKNGVRVVIIGKPNVGKSTLLNALIKENKAIVTDIPGTTRDIVEGEVNIGGVVFFISDTAGIRDSNDKIEQIGIKKTFEAVKKADLIIYVKDSTTDKRDINLDDKKIIEVVNKSDLIKKKNNNYLYISALKNDIKQLIEKIKDVVNISSLNCNKPCFSNIREIGLLKQADKLISEILLEIDKKTPIDVIIVLINNLLNVVLEIFGEKISVDITKEIFSHFCVGK